MADKNYRAARARGKTSHAITTGSANFARDAEIR
jgi:hypothetical protein